ncbi:MAG TPA: tetratricopeptide repeat protein [Pirellulales bacterium]|jgi:tetratricopeptide (TPR) repeat protein
MAPEFRQFDEHGFPLPPRFDNLKLQDDPSPRTPHFSIKTKRLVLLVVVLGVIVPVIFGPQILAAGRDALAHWLSNRAGHKYLEGNYSGAIADASLAIGWSPQSRELYFLRAQCREKVDDLNGSLDDWNQSIGLTTSSVELSLIHACRSWIYVRLQRYQEAIDDASKAVRLSPTSSNLNTRAYVRALANMELNDGLVDINKALAEEGDDNAEFLDTRAFLLHLLDRNDDALKDLDRAIKLTERYKLTMQLQRSAFSPRDWRAQVKETNHSLAVMYHHRGLVYDKLARQEEAEHDRRQAVQLGYNPAQGVL